MQPVEFFRWWLPPDAWHRKRHLSSWRMSRAEAQKRYPGAEPDLSSREVRECPEDAGEALRTSATAPYTKR